MTKQLSMFAILAILISGVKAQTTEGFKISPSISSVDVRGNEKLNRYLGSTAKQNLNVGVDAGYFGKVLGLAVTAQTDFDFDSPVLLGLKGFVNIVKVDNIVFKGELGASRFIKDVKGDPYQYKGAISANVPLFNHFDFKGAFQVTSFGDDNFKRYYPGVAAGIVYGF